VEVDNRRQRTGCQHMGWQHMGWQRTGCQHMGLERVLFLGTSRLAMG
jgi:hypothetical protein